MDVSSEKVGILHSFVGCQIELLNDGIHFRVLVEKYVVMVVSAIVENLNKRTVNCVW